MRHSRLFALGFLWFALTTACSKKPSPTADAHDGPNHAAHAHEHKAPHGGTPVVLGQEAYHLELVLDRSAGKLSAYVLDGEMDNYLRLTAPSFEAIANMEGMKQTLVFKAAADSATGEKVGDTALFEATADWLKTATTFDAVITAIQIRGTTFADVAFNFPKGNDPH